MTTVVQTLTPSTDRAVASAQNLIGIVAAAEDNPVVKADLQAQFDSYSHVPIVVAIAAGLGWYLTQNHITVDNTLLTVVVGTVLTGLGYAYQWLSMKIHKPIATGAKS